MTNVQTRMLTLMLDPPRSTYQMPKTPSLFTQMSMGNDSNNARVYGSMTNALMLDHLAMVQVTIVNT